MRDQGARFSGREFALSRVAPLIPELAGTACIDCSVEPVRLKGTRLTLRCVFVSSATVFAKAYRTARGRTTYAALRALWEGGFGAGSTNRVPEPLGYLEEENIVISRAARGVPLAQVLQQAPLEEAAETARMAARWLLQLHSSCVPFLEPESPSERAKVLKESDTITRAAAACPRSAAALMEFWKGIHSLSRRLRNTPLVPTHGQFTPSTAFVDGNTITAIDLDTVCLSDPSRDVATFLGKLVYKELFRGGAAALRAVEIGRAFLDAYKSGGGSGLANLPYYQAQHCLKAFSKFIADAGAEDLPAAEAVCRAELQRCHDECKQMPARRAPAAAQDGEPLRVGRTPRPRLPSRTPWSGIRRIGGPTRASASGPGGPPHSLDFCNELLTHDTSDAQVAELLSKATLIQSKSTDRVTWRVEASPGTVLYAKSYTGRQGVRTAEIHRALWTGGFGSGSAFRVPEPIGFAPKHNLLLSRAAPGAPLSNVLEWAGPEELTGAVRNAARWLAALHRSPVRIGEPQAEWDSLELYRLMERVIKLCSAAPASLGPVLDLLYALKHQVECTPACARLVQTHGSYRPVHIFVADGVTTAIDLDRSAPADPARDAGEFLSELRLKAVQQPSRKPLMQLAEEVFLREYLSGVPEVGPRLPCHVASHGMLHALKISLSSSCWESGLEAGQVLIAEPAWPVEEAKR